jgi:hypothetical protein
VDCSVPQGSVLGPQEFIAYTEDLTCLIDRYGISHHLYADDTQLIDSCRFKDISVSTERLQQCIETIHGWCASRRLQLNPSKTEVIWFGTAASVKKISGIDSSLRVGDAVINSVNVVRDLGVLLDSELSMKQHISKVTSTCFFLLRRLKQVRRVLGPDITANLVSAFVLSRLDYCNALFAGLPKSTILPLQRVQNAAARLITGLRSRDHVTPALLQLHWLPVQYRIIYKLCVLMHLAHTRRGPSYLTNLLTACADIPSLSRLRSASSSRYVLPRTSLRFGERAFSFAAPSAWNDLPEELRRISDSNAFKKQLKSYLFSRAYTF